MEAAEYPLSDLLSNVVVFPSHTLFEQQHIKHQLALDIGAGLEAIHALNIIHGDIKPANILIFPQDDLDVPLVAKLSDFGVCIDMSQSTISPYAYSGTIGWRGPEKDAEEYDEVRFGKFEAPHLKQFDAFSYGMLLLALFVTDKGLPPILGSGLDPEWSGQKAAARMIDTSHDLRLDIRTTLRTAIQRLLARRPCDRPLPAPDLLKNEMQSYKYWLRASARYFDVDPRQMRKNPLTNRGPQYWAVLDEDLLAELDQQYVDFRGHRTAEKLPPFSGAIMLGLAQKFSNRQGIDISWLESREKVLDYILTASQSGHIPAQAICKRVFDALGQPVPVQEQTLETWARRAVQTGYLAHHFPDISTSEHAKILKQFREEGGYCMDRFRTKPEILLHARNPMMLREWIKEHPLNMAVDIEGNTMLHVCAAIGGISGIELLLDLDRTLADNTNDNGETPLYKACQGGHLNALRVFCLTGCKSIITTNGVSPLHWLFVFPDGDVATAVELLLKSGADLEYSIHKEVQTDLSDVTSFHFPFFWPLGTPLHWAVFARNDIAIDRLLDVGAKIDWPYSKAEPATTPLSHAVYRGDHAIVSKLLLRGANPLIRDKKGRNLLHIMSSGHIHAIVPNYKLRKWIQHGDYHDAMGTTMKIVRRLVQEGVSINDRASDYNRKTPLLQSSEDTSKDEIVSCALLAGGADATVTTSSSGVHALSEWCVCNSQALAYPQGYLSLVSTLISLFPDVNLKSGYDEDTALHKVMSSSGTTEQIQQVASLLVQEAREARPPANIDAINARGLTPLAQAVCADVKTLHNRVKIALDLGARPDITNDNGENCVTQVLRNNRLMDEESNDIILMIVNHLDLDAEELSRFIDSTNLSALANSCADVKPMTTRTLLNLGMARRVNDLCDSSLATNMRPLDQAYWGACVSRMTYMRMASNYATQHSRDRAERSGAIYCNNSYGSNSNGQPGSERCKEAYWVYPQLFRLLQQFGATRSPVSPDRWENEPTYADAYQLPILGFKSQTQPHRKHWQALYTLEDLQAGWEDEVLSRLRDMLVETDMFAPTVCLLERWPEIVDVLAPLGENWYWAEDSDTSKVEVQIVDGVIVGKRVARSTHWQSRDT